MNRNILRARLDALGVDPGNYSLNGDLLADSVVLRNSYEGWIVFYFDERGNETEKKVFESESEACRYILDHFSQNYRGASKQ